MEPTSNTPSPPPPPHLPSQSAPYPYGSYPPVALAYHQAPGIRKPTGVVVLAIIGIVLASFWMLGGLFGALSLAFVAYMWVSQAVPPNMAGYRELMLWNFGSSIVGGLIGILLLVAAIGCLRMAPWGRRWIVRYALIDLAWIVVKLVVTLAWAIPAQERWTNTIWTTPTTPPTTAPVAPPTPTTGPVSVTTFSTSGQSSVTTVTTTTAGGATTVAATSVAAMSPIGGFGDAMAQIIIAVCTAVGMAIYPIIALVYMTRPHIKAAFIPGVPQDPFGPA